MGAFYQQPTPEAFKVAYDNSKMVFDALKGWLQGSPASELSSKARIVVRRTSLEAALQCCREKAAVR